MSYSNSTFTVEIDGTPTVVFQAKWHSEAEEICQGWTRYHWEQLPKKELRGHELPPFVKVRLAHVDERARYGAEDASSEFFEEAKSSISLSLMPSTKRTDQMTGRARREASFVALALPK